MIRREIILPAPREEVWDALTEPDRLADWFANDVDLDLRPGGGATTHDFTLRIAAVADDVIVTASRIAESRSTATESLAVFSATDIQALGSTSLVDVLRMVPGLNIESTGREIGRAHV